MRFTFFKSLTLAAAVACQAVSAAEINLLDEIFDGQQEQFELA